MLEEFLTQFFRAWMVGGAICVIGQLLFDVAHLTPAHTMSLMVSVGSILGILGLYPLLVDFAGMGAMLPISSFGNTLVDGASSGLDSQGFIGIFSGMLQPVSIGVTAAVLFGFAAALLAKPKS